MSRRTMIPVLLLGVPLVVGTLAVAAPDEQPPTTQPAGSSETKDAKLKELLKDQLATLHELVKVATAEYRTGRGSLDRVLQATRAVRDAELQRCESDKERIRVLEEIVALTNASEKNAAQLYKAGQATQSDALVATAARLEAEIALERVKSKAPVQTK